MVVVAVTNINTNTKININIRVPAQVDQIQVQWEDKEVGVGVATKIEYYANDIFYMQQIERIEGIDTYLQLNYFSSPPLTISEIIPFSS